MIELKNDLTQNEKNPYFSITHDVEVSVRPQFIDSQVNGVNNLYVWAYHVKISNKSDKALQLIARYWKIIDENGMIEEVSGEGVIGEKPTLSPDAFFEYSSGVHLKTSSGIMLGHYKMRDEDDEVIEVKIPAFSLDVPNSKQTTN